MERFKYISCADIANMRWKRKVKKLREDLSDYLMTCEYVGLKEKSEILKMFDDALED